MTLRSLSRSMISRLTLVSSLLVAAKSAACALIASSPKPARLSCSFLVSSS